MVLLFRFKGGKQAGVGFSEPANMWEKIFVMILTT